MKPKQPDIRAKQPRFLTQFVPRGLMVVAVALAVALLEHPLMMRRQVLVVVVAEECQHLAQEFRQRLRLARLGCSPPLLGMPCFLSTAYLVLVRSPVF
jgi:hypothetical protein